MSTDAEDTTNVTHDDASTERNADRQEAAPAEAAPESTADTIDEVPQTLPKPAPKLCGICEKEEAKYKCPRCSLP